MRQNEFVVEFRNGSYFRGPRSRTGGTLGQAMRFDQVKHAEAYVDNMAPWAWSNGAAIIDAKETK